MKRTLALVALAALSFAVASGAAVKPKPWQWTPAQAVQAIRAYGEEIGPEEITAVSCRGTGKAVTGRFSAFRCPVTFAPASVSAAPTKARLTARTRRAGGLCFTTTAVVPSGCLAPGPRGKGSITEAARAVYAKLGVPAQSFTARAHGAGFYSWTWSSGGVERRGTAVFSPQPVVRVAP